MLIGNAWCLELSFPFHLLFNRYQRVNSVQTAQREWQKDREPDLRQALKTAAECAILEQPDNQELGCILKSTMERQLEYGLSE